MKWSEWIAAIAYLVVIGWIADAHGTQAATLAIGIGIFIALFCLLHEVRTEVRSIRTLVDEKKAKP
jgi:Kef-type K+ transport system membrane component KefB